MSPPIRDGSGNSIGSIRLGDGSEISEVRTGAGDVVFSAAPPIPNSAILQVDPVASFSSTDDGASITGSIPDESGNGNDLGNDQGGATVVDNGINGVLSLDFDRGPDEYSVSFPTIPQPTTTFAVVQYQDTSPHEVYGSASGGSEHIFQGHVNGTDRITAGTILSDGASDQNPHLFTLIFDGLNSVIRKDGSQVASGNAGANGLDGFRLGDSGVFTTNTNSLIGEVLPCSERLSQSEIDSQEQRIADKYGITL